MVEPREAAELTGGPLDEGTRVDGEGVAAPSSQMLSAVWEQAVLAPRVAVPRGGRGAGKQAR